VWLIWRQDDREKHGEKKQYHRYRQFGRQSRGLFFGEQHTIITAFLGNDPQGGAKRGAVALGLNENGRDLLHRVDPGPEAEVFIGRAPVWKIRQFRRRQRQFLRKRYRLDADFLRDLAKGMFDRHAGLDADEQQIHGVGKGAAHRMLAFADRILEVEFRHF
jgi:hypothetical protein